MRNDNESVDNDLQRTLFKVRVSLEAAAGNAADRNAAVAAKAFTIACDSPSCGLLGWAAASAGERKNPDDVVRVLVNEVAAHISPESAKILRDVAGKALGRPGPTAAIER